MRQAVIKVTIEKKTYNPENGLPRFDVTLVCKQQKAINVYQTPFEQLFLDPQDLNLVQCTSELFGSPVSVVVGGYINLYQDTSTGTPLQLKSAALLLSWGALDREVPQVVYPAATDTWSYYVAVLSPIATGKIVDSVPQPPEPREFFMLLWCLRESAGSSSPDQHRFKVFRRAGTV